MKKRNQFAFLFFTLGQPQAMLDNLYAENIQEPMGRHSNTLCWCE